MNNESDIERQNEEARREAEAELDRSVSLLLYKDGEEMSAVELLMGDLERAINAANHSNDILPGCCEAKVLAKVLSTPVRYEWNVLTDETERDPISGNWRRKSKRDWRLTEWASSFREIRGKFVELVGAQTLYAQRVGSPVFAEFRALHVALQAYVKALPPFAAYEAERAEWFANEYNRLEFELWCDLELAKYAKKNVKRGVRHG